MIFFWKRRWVGVINRSGFDSNTCRASRRSTDPIGGKMEDFGVGLP